jgi:isopenicillin N synthase-like dioxygenase
MALVPIIDVAAEDSPRRIDAACRDIGFFVAIGHGVPQPVVDSAWAAARAFFDLPSETRMASRFPNEPYGYEPIGGEALSDTDGARPATGDAKQTFNIGPPFRGDHTGFGAFERRWPTEPYELRVSWLAYYAEMETLSDRLLALCARALGAPAAFFEPHVDRHLSALRALDYPASDRSESLRAGAHSDYGTLTILRPDPIVSGIEIEDGSGNWTSPASVPGGFVINIGDLLHRWSNGRWRSARHRVVADPLGRRRSSMAFFHNPNWDARVAPITGSGEEPIYDAVIAGPWLQEKVDAAHHI